MSNILWKVGTNTKDFGFSLVADIRTIHFARPLFAKKFPFKFSACTVCQTWMLVGLLELPVLQSSSLPPSVLWPSASSPSSQGKLILSKKLAVKSRWRFGWRKLSFQEKMYEKRSKNWREANTQMLCIAWGDEVSNPSYIIVFWPTFSIALLSNRWRPTNCGMFGPLPHVHPLTRSIFTEESSYLSNLKEIFGIFLIFVLKVWGQ